jgi:hypothetical protein
MRHKCLFVLWVLFRTLKLVSHCTFWSWKESSPLMLPERIKWTYRNEKGVQIFSA